jgi:hypothetical protein
MEQPPPQQYFAVEVEYVEPPRENRGPARVAHEFRTTGVGVDAVRDVVIQRAAQAGLIVEKLVVTRLDTEIARTNPTERAD